MPIPESIYLSHQDLDWLQTLDYEFVPFHYRCFNEQDHLYRDFPLLQPPKYSKQDPEIDG